MSIKAFVSWTTQPNVNSWMGSSQNFLFQVKQEGEKFVTQQTFEGKDFSFVLKAFGRVFFDKGKYKSANIELMSKWKKKNERTSLL